VTAATLLTTILVEIFVLTRSGLDPHSSNPVAEVVGGVLLKVLALFFGVAVNLVAAWIAYKRRKTWGVRIAAFGLVVCLGTLAAGTTMWPWILS
jgi:hypothetical protein